MQQLICQPSQHLVGICQPRTPLWQLHCTPPQIRLKLLQVNCALRSQRCREHQVRLRHPVQLPRQRRFEFRVFHAHPFFKSCHVPTVPAASWHRHIQRRHLFGSPFVRHLEGFPMSRRNWKRISPTSLVDALRLCKEFAQERGNLSIERIADRMGVTHDSLYKWLATGRLPSILIPAYEHACGCHFASTWLNTSAGKLVIDMPKGRNASPADMVQLNSDFAAMLQHLTDFYADPGKADTTEVVAALTSHLQQVAYHRANVAQHANPELDFA